MAAHEPNPTTGAPLGYGDGTLTVEGDTELGLRVKNMLDALEWPHLSWQGMRPTFLHG